MISVEEPSGAEIQPTQDPQTPLSPYSLPMDDPTSLPEEANAGAAGASTPKAAPALSSPAHSHSHSQVPLIPGSRAQIRRRRRVAPLVTNTLSTIGTLGVGAAMMWYGLSEMNI